MNCEILTFQFAHNYGALLQCYALKKYIESLGHNVSVSDFKPESVENVYKLWPEIDIKHPLTFLRKLKRALKRKNQYEIFESFIKNEIPCNARQNPDYLFIGSDQIWNESITGNICEYYGAGYENVVKVSYAGSFGTNILTEFQKQNILRYFDDFKMISLRESCNLEEVEQLTGKYVKCVLDPVFLLERHDWDNFVTEVDFPLKEKYILFYALRNDPELIKEVKELAEELNAKVLSIHPTGVKFSPDFIQLYNVGPREFIYLIKNAEMVGTNSFHAISFSQIYGKKVIYKSYSKNESRVPTIINYCGMEYEKNGSKIYDFDSCDSSLITKIRIDSMNFIKDVFT